MITKNAWYLYGLLVCFFSYMACEVCEPTTTLSEKITVKFYQRNRRDTTKYELMDSVIVNRVAGEGQKYLFRLIYRRGEVIRQKSNKFMRLPLSTIADSATFIINIDTGTRAPFQTMFSNMTIRYHKKVILNTPDCGYYQKFDQITLVSHLFDSARVANNSVQFDTTISNIDIFIK